MNISTYFIVRTLLTTVVFGLAPVWIRVLDADITGGLLARPGLLVGFEFLSIIATILFFDMTFKSRASNPRRTFTTSRLVFTLSALALISMFAIGFTLSEQAPLILLIYFLLSTFIKSVSTRDQFDANMLLFIILAFFIASCAAIPAAQNSLAQGTRWWYTYYGIILIAQVYVLFINDRFGKAQHKP